MPLSVFDRRDAWTFDDLATLPPDTRRFEVVDGNLLVSPEPTEVHQVVARRLFLQLHAQAPAGWEAVYEPGVRLGTDGRIGDVGLIRADVPVRRRQVGRTPDQYALVVEVVSPHSRKTDRFFKPAEYALAGIPAYWRIETEPELLLVVHRLTGATHEQVQRLTGVGVVEEPFRMELDLPALMPPLLD